MTPTEFVVWLSGFFASREARGLKEADMKFNEVQTVLKHLSYVKRSCARPPAVPPVVLTCPK